MERLMGIATQPKFEGITPLYVDKNGADVDIIAVPGLGSHALGSWKAQNTDEVWLRDFLPEDIPNIRVLIYGYDTTLLDSLSKQSVEDLGSTFLEQISAFRANDDTSRRPIILIGHSLGGLLVKEALIRARRQRSYADSDLSKACFGLLFFGVPNLGLRNEQLRTLVEGQPNKALVDTLLTDNDSEPSAFLKRLADQFSESCKGYYHVVTFFERVLSPTIKLTQDGKLKKTGRKSLLVTERSATSTGLVVMAEQDNIPLNTNHSELVKYKSRNQGEYTIVRGILRTLVDKAKPEVAKRFTEHVDVLSQGALSANRHSEPHSLHQVGAHYVIPSIETRHFTGRGTILDKLKEMLFIHKESPKVALFGLGGVGKTQVALQLANWAKEHRPAYSIFWIPALSEGNFNQACSEIVRKLDIRKIPDNENAMESVQRYLSSEAAGPWLFVVDNADDFDMIFGSADNPGGLYKYLPTSDNGVTLLTSCFRKVAVSAADSDIIELQSMTPEEATPFFHKVLKKSVLCNQASIARLLEELNWLPLAITQAAAYISETDISIETYLNLMQSTDNNRTSLLSRNPHDSTRYPGLTNAVATIWLISFNRIKDYNNAAAELLEFMSCIEPKAIPRSILPKLGSEEEMEFAIGTLSGYAFLTKREDGNMFDMHSLVQLATRLWVQMGGNAPQTIRSATWQMAIAFPSSDYINREVWRGYLPHALSLLQKNEACDMEERYELFHKVGLCLLEDGRVKEAVFSFQEDLKWKEVHYSADHPSQLASQHELASAYQADGENKQAVKLLEHVVTVREKTLSEEHPDQLASQHVLAGAYQTDGQIKQAVKLLEHVVTVEQRIYDEEHPSKLASQHELAHVYQADGQIKQAVKLLEHVITVRERTQDEEHPDQLASQHVLACAYQADGQIKQAVKLLEHVITVRERTQDEEHPDQLASQHVLACAYQADGQIKQAVKLLENVITVRERTQDEEHPDQLASQHVLAFAYQADGQIKQAVKLLEHVVTVEQRIYDEEHPDQLASQQALARAYQTQKEEECY